MNNKGYTIKELIILLAVVTLVAAVSITKISFAFSDIDISEEIKNEETTLIIKAANIYAETIKDQLKEEKKVYISGKDLIEKGLLTDDTSYNSLKVKLTYNEEKDSINVEIV